MADAQPGEAEETAGAVQRRTPGVTADSSLPPSPPLMTGLDRDDKYKVDDVDAWPPPRRGGPPHRHHHHHHHHWYRQARLVARASPNEPAAPPEPGRASEG